MKEKKGFSKYNAMIELLNLDTLIIGLFGSLFCLGSISVFPQFFDVLDLILRFNPIDIVQFVLWLLVLIFVVVLTFGITVLFLISVLCLYIFIDSLVTAVNIKYTTLQALEGLELGEYTKKKFIEDINKEEFGE